MKEKEERGIGLLWHPEARESRSCGYRVTWSMGFTTQPLREALSRSTARTESSKRNNSSHRSSAEGSRGGATAVRKEKTPLLVPLVKQSPRAASRSRPQEQKLHGSLQKACGPRRPSTEDGRRISTWRILHCFPPIIRPCEEQHLAELFLRWITSPLRFSHPQANCSHQTSGAHAVREGTGEGSGQNQGAHR